MRNGRPNYDIVQKLLGTIINTLPFTQSVLAFCREQSFQRYSNIEI